MLRPMPLTIALLTLLCAALVPSGCGAQPADSLDASFANPPDSAKPHTWWHWMHGNITKTGITNDLEAMKRVGLGGAQIFDVTDGIPEGPVDYLSPEWREMVAHAIREADRLGIEICMHNCAGWSSSGGPWVTPDQAMQMVTTAEVRATGPGRIDTPLPQPETRHDFYRDIAVLAFPTPADEHTMAAAKPVASASVEGCEAARLVDQDPRTHATLRLVRAGAEEYIELAFDQPFSARGLTVERLGGQGGVSGELQASEDGQAFRRIAGIYLGEHEPTSRPASVSFDPVAATRFRLVFRRSGSLRAVTLSEITLESGVRLSNWATKAGYGRGNPGFESREAPQTAVTPAAQVRDITALLLPDGRLDWEVPAGEWTVLRLGHTTTGKTNHPASDSGIGLECDKLSAEAGEAAFNAVMGAVISDVGPLAGKAFNNVLIDSYEVFCQNWTPKMRQDFQSRRGYDPLPYLPALTGRIIDSVEVTERFLWDFRRTLADLYADNYFGAFARLCHERGMMMSTEAYGNGNFDEITCGGRADIPMSEFWVGQGNGSWVGKMAGSTAHTYGRKFVGAESFTADPSQGGWRNHPYSMKALGDSVYCSGINRFIFHRYAHQPWEGVVPGMTMGPHGFHFDRFNTWWQQAPAWTKYLARCQYLLQEGKFVADVCYYTGEGSPAGMPALRPALPPGYNYDACDTQVLMTRMSVQNGDIVLPDGMRYRYLVLPQSDRMSPEVLAKVAELVRAGATVIGPKPRASFSLTGYPGCDEEVRRLADELWGPCDGKTVTEHRVGAGRIVWGKSLEDLFAEAGVGPDVICTTDGAPANAEWIHRRIGDADVYFISHQMARWETVDCSFRVEGLQPELWQPQTGEIQAAPMFRTEAGRTVASLLMGPVESVFVVFRNLASDRPHLVAATRNGKPVYELDRGPLPELTIDRAIYGVLAPPDKDYVDVTSQLSLQVRDNRLSVRATNAIAGDPAPNIIKEMRVDYTLDGEKLTARVEENQLLEIPAPGRAGELRIVRAIYGIIPENPDAQDQPQTVDVTEQVRARVKDRHLTVAASNALAGDPANLIVKQMVVDYRLDGKPYSRTVNENQIIDLPDGSEGMGGAMALPAAELSLPEPGRLQVTAWSPGAYEFTSSAGRTVQADVPAGLGEMAVTGPWELRFPPNLGAPEMAVLDELIDWTESDIEGIRHFSGTATYQRAIDVPAGWLAPGHRVLLDLGMVREIAQVSLNGQDLGILWKPPFHLDVTGALQAGTNMLEVRVTNLWPNRLIGDEKLPLTDRDWGGGPAIRTVPEWLLTGAPRPATERVTFTTWRHWDATSPLQPSGLIGPVTLHSGRVVEVDLR